jgi:hypothetical protein
LIMTGKCEGFGKSCSWVFATGVQTVKILNEKNSTNSTNSTILDPQ